jgi:hypothetical protein
VKNPSFLCSARGRPPAAVFVQSAQFHIFFAQMFVQIDEKKFPKTA